MTTKPKKPNSPAVPSYSLRDSLEDARKLYASFSHAVFNRAEVASTLGMSSNSGPFTGRMFSVRTYGLLVESAGGYKISDAFLTLNSEDRSSAAFKRVALQAIQRASIFAEILAEFRTKLPPIASVAQRLETQKKFNAERAKKVASILEKSLQFAGVLDSNNNILPVRDSDVPGASSGAEKEEKSDIEVPITASGAKAGLRRTEVPLGDGRVAVVQYPHDLVKIEADKIGRVLGALVD